MKTQDIAEIIYAHTSLDICEQDEVHAAADVIQMELAGEERRHIKARSKARASAAERAVESGEGPGISPLVALIVVNVILLAALYVI